LQIKVANYLKLVYPSVKFQSDFASGCKLTMGQAIRNAKMQCGRKMPDMFIAFPNGKYAGCYLELKKNRECVYLKDGSLSKGQHIQEQAKVHEELRSIGYWCDFSCGFEEAICVIEDYLPEHIKITLKQK
jgi:hypothetical protein